MKKHQRLHIVAVLTTIVACSILILSFVPFSILERFGIDEKNGNWLGPVCIVLIYLSIILWIIYYKLSKPKKTYTPIQIKRLRMWGSLTLSYAIVSLFVALLTTLACITGADEGVSAIHTMCLLCWIIFTPSLTIATATCWISYFQPLIEKRREGKRIALRREKQKQHEADLERRVAAGEFQMYLQQFEHLAKTATELLPVSQDKHGFSKFGGLPLVPSCFRWPRHNDEPRQFVAQFDFAEINPDGQLKDFPTTGLMYVFVDEDPYERDDCKVLFFEKLDNFTLAKKPNDLGTVYKEIYLTVKPLKTYPVVEDCPEAAKICADNPQDGMDEVYEKFIINDNMERHFVGGWGSYIQDAYFLPEQEHPEDWVLLCQIASDENCDDDGFMWSDAGTLYFYIRKEDLIAHKFDNVQLDMQCG